MKKVLKIMLSAMLLCTLLVPFTACGDNTPDPNAEYKILDYFEDFGGGTTNLQKMMSSMTPASSANASSNYASIPDGTWKAGEAVFLAKLPKNNPSFVVRNLKIEFYPA